MLDRISQRLVKEGLIWLYRNHIRTCQYPVYYMSVADKDPKEYGLVVKSLHEMSQIPWPDTNCLICSEDHVSNMFPTMGIRLLNIIVHQEGIKTPEFDEASIDCIEPFEIISVFLLEQTNSVHIAPSKHLLVHVANETKEIDLETILEQGIENRIDYIETQMKNKLSPEERRNFSVYLRSTAPKKSFWTAFETKDFKSYKSAKDGFQNIGLATDTLSYLSNIIAPSHYLLKSHFEKGFGPTGAMQRMTKDKPIFSFVSYNRLHKCFHRDEHDPEYEVSPHFRRGHIRHLWMKAGIDRFSLPDTVMERMKLVAQKKVERIYIPPTWIGERVITENGIRHEVVADEMRLPNL